MKISRYKQWTMIAGLIVVLVVQLVMMCYFGGQKSGYHVDEIYTYELANYQETFFSNTEGFMESWVDGDFYREAMSLDGVGDLDYSIPYHNQEKDVHPPLYYFVIHTVSAFFGGTVSKWIGILPNMIFCLLTTVLFFLVGKRILPNQGLVLVVAAMWAWSVGCMSTAVFIRMYAMLTFFCMALVYIHVMALSDVKQGKFQKRTMGLLFLVTLAGILTQYYYLVFCFFLCGIFFLYLGLTKRWKQLVQYTVIEGAALCASVAIFPQMLYHIFGGYRGQEAFKNMAQSGGYLADLKAITTIISRQLCNGWVKECVLLIVAIVVVYFLWGHVFRLHLKKSEGAHGSTADVPVERKFQLHVSSMDVVVALLGAVAVGYVMLISKVAPYKTDRYIFCIYPLVCLCLGYLGYRTVLLLIRKPWISLTVIAVLTVGITVASYQKQTVNYLYLSMEKRQESLSAYREYPIVTVAINRTHDNGADVFAIEFMDAPEVFRCYKGGFEGLSKAADTKDIADGFLLYVQDYGSMSHEEIKKQVEQQVDLDQFELVTNVGCRVYFCTLEETAP